MSVRDPEIEAEQAYVDAAYGQLDVMRAAARRIAAGYSEVGRGGTHQARLERDVAEDATRRRLAALDVGDLPLCFGRLDRTDDATHYVGRISVTGPESTPLVVDWRAPVAEPFYRATAVEPMDVVRRRHFLTRPNEGRVIVALDDEVFDADRADAAGLSVMGEGALLSALERARTGRMGDIVATIQAEQDEAIRAPLPGMLIVTGGAGTGKTAVALHRAAYLLYTYRSRLGSQGVLLVGPNSIFLRYIDQVLPSLGENEVRLATPASLRPQYRVGAADTPAAARVKGDLRMVNVIANALRDREHRLPRDAVMVLDDTVLRLSRGATARIIERVSAQRGLHNEKRPRVVRAVVEHLRFQYRNALGATAPEDRDWDRELDTRIRRLPEVRAALERMWPVLSGADLVHDLCSFHGLVRSASRNLLTDEEQQSLVRPRAASLREVPWTEADIGLIDEADTLLGPTDAAKPRRRRSRRAFSDETADRVVANLGVGGFMTAGDIARRYAGDAGSNGGPIEPGTYGHVLVDEAQDLSPMQWRMLSRRCPSGSMTVVGDFGQASKVGSARGWDDVARIVDAPQQARMVNLSVNYRTPAEIMEVAHRVLAAAAPGIEPTRAVRHTGVHPRFEAVPADLLVDRVAAAAREAAAAEGTSAVIAPHELHSAIVDALVDVGAVAGNPDALDAPIAVLGASEAKGLEFDSVVVVEPADLVASDTFGLRLLYVVLTRATKLLVIVHSEPLPESLAVSSVVGSST